MLAGSPGLENLSVSFLRSYGPSQVDFDAALRAGAEQSVLTAAYRRPGHTRGIGVMFIGESWSIQVYPVLREFRSQARQLLLDLGSAHLRDWLAPSTRSDWPCHDRRLSIRFSSSTNTLTAESVLDHQIFR